MKRSSMIMVGVVALALVGCSRVETGEVGLRVGFDKQVQKIELQPGSFNQTIVGDVLTFPVRAISLPLDHLHPQTKDKSTLADMDITVIYNINPSSVWELYTTQSSGFHAVSHGETYLMYMYLTTVANSASYKAVADFNALDTITNRGQIETNIMENMNNALKAEKLDTAIRITQVQVRNIQPADSIIQSANAVINQQNNLRAKQIEVEVSQKEAERLKALSGSPGSIEYMHAKALQDIAEGIKEGKVNAVVIPYDFHGLLNVPTTK